MCETFIGVMLNNKSRLVITMLEEIWGYAMNKIVVKRDYAMKWKVDFRPNIVAKIEKERAKVRNDSLNR